MTDSATRTALVTGGAGGIGRSCAQALARAGFQLVVCDIDQAGGEETCRLIAKAGGRARFQTLDVARGADWRSAIDGIDQAEGSLGALVNNAGVCIASPLLEMSHASWRRQIEINLDGVFLGTKAAIPLMARSGGGSIVNISSVAGLKGVANLAGYCATKGGVRLFTKAVALECAHAKNNIRVNSVHPGAIETPIWAKMGNDGIMPKGDPSVLSEAMAQARERAAEATPIGFAGAPEDIAGGVVYLCSDAARFVTGAELVIDGGAFA